MLESRIQLFRSKDNPRPEFLLKPVSSPLPRSSPSEEGRKHPMDVFARNGVAGCDLLKLDVDEGAYEILRGASDPTFARTARIAAEDHDVSPADPRTRIGAFAEFPSSRGYAVEIRPRRRKANFGRFFARHA